MLGSLGRWNVTLEALDDDGQVLRTFRIGNVSLRYVEHWRASLQQVLEIARREFRLAGCWWHVTEVLPFS